MLNLVIAHPLIVASYARSRSPRGMVMTLTQIGGEVNGVAIWIAYGWFKRTHNGRLWLDWGA